MSRMLSLANFTDDSKNSVWVRLVAPSSEARTPIHLICVIDVSGSMAEESRLENVKHTLKCVLDFMTPADKLSLVSFSSGSSVLLKQQPMTDFAAKHHAQMKIDSMVAMGNTNLSAGILDGASCLEADGTAVKQVMLLLTDGEANAGIVAVPQLTLLVQQCIGANPLLTVTSIGYGGSHNSELLVGLGNGFYSAVNNLEDVATTFGEVFGTMATTVAQAVKLRLPVGSTVVGSYTMDASSVIVGDMSAGAETALLVKVPEGSTVLSLSYFDCVEMKFEAQVVEIGDVDPSAADAVRLYILRQDVAAFLKSGLQTADGVCALIARCLSNDGLEGMLKRDLEAVRDRLASNRSISAAETVQAAQNATFYGRARGVHSQWSGLAPPEPLNIFTSPLAAQISGGVTRNITGATTIRAVSPWLSGSGEDPADILSHFASQMENVD